MRLLVRIKVISEGTLREVAQISLSVTVKSEAEIACILLERHDRNVTVVTDSKQYQPY